MLYTKADGSGGVTNTAQAGWVPIKGTDTMTSGAQIAYKPATYVPGTATVAAPASWTTPGTSNVVTAPLALKQGLIGAPPPAAAAAAPNPGPSPQEQAAGKTPEGVKPPENAAADQANDNASDGQHPDSATFDTEELAESGQITQEQADSASMENLEKYVTFEGGSEEDRREFMEAFQKFVLQGFLYGRDVLAEISANGTGGQMTISYNGAQGYDGMATGGAPDRIDFAPGYGNSGGGSEDWLVFHELGHEVLGLDHSPPTGGSGKSNVMNYYSAGDFAKDPRHWGGELFAESNWGDPTKWGQQTPGGAPPREVDPKTYGTYDPARDKAADESQRKTGGAGTGPVKDAPKPVTPEPSGNVDDSSETSQVQDTGDGTTTQSDTELAPRVQGPVGQPQMIQPMIGSGLQSNPLAGSEGGFDPAEFGAVGLDSRDRGDDSPELPDSGDTGDAPPAPNPGSSQEAEYFRSALAENLKRAPAFGRGGVLARR